MDSLLTTEHTAGVVEGFLQTLNGWSHPPGNSSLLCQPPPYQIIPDCPGTGVSQADLTTSFWKWGYSVPDQNPNEAGYQGPFNDATGEYAGVNQSGPVFFLAGPLFVPGGPNPVPLTRKIEVPFNKEIFLPVLNVEWDNAQLQAFFASYFTNLPDQGILSPQELRNLNKNTMETTKGMFFKVDGDTLFSDADWLVNGSFNDALIQYRKVTPDPGGFDYTIPGPEAEKNALGLPWAATDDGQGLIRGGLSDGIWIYLKLAPGQHELSFGGTFEFGSINIDLNGNGVSNEPGKELAYQDAFKSLGSLVLGVNDIITQLGPFG